MSASRRFLLFYPLWFLILFGLFYWGRYWSFSPIGEAVDGALRELIMHILDAILPNKIEGYEIIINPKYRVVITPECNGMVPFLIYLAGVLAYPKELLCKLFWSALGLFAFMFFNVVRLVIVVLVVNSFGDGAFFWIHDIGGNLLLVMLGSILFVNYLNRCS